VDVVAAGKAEVRSAFEVENLPVERGLGERGAEARRTGVPQTRRRVEERLVPGGDHDRQAGEVGYAAHVVPVRVGQQDRLEPAEVIAGRFQLVGGRLPQLVSSDGLEIARHGSELPGDVTAEPGIDEQVAVRVLDQRGADVEVPAVEDRAAAIGVRGHPVVDPGRHGDQLHILRRLGTGDGHRPRQRAGARRRSG
jgi:hypothetical protein